jgi:hypothetical protein
VGNGERETYERNKNVWNKILSHWRPGPHVIWK